MNYLIAPRSLFVLCNFCIYLPVSLRAGDTFEWTDSAGSNNWVASGNWSQNPGSGDYPSQKQSDDTVHLFGDFSNNTAKFDIDLTTSSSPSDGTAEINDLLIYTDNAADAWVVSHGAQTGTTLEVSNTLGYWNNGGGSCVINPTLKLGDNKLVVGVQGGSLILNGSLSGGSNSILDLHTSSGDITIKGDGSISGGVLQLNASDNDSFTGTIEVGNTGLYVAQSNGARFAEINLIGSKDVSYVNNTLLGALTGWADCTLASSTLLKVGNSNSNVSYTGGLSGAGALEKVGSGTWSLGGAGTHTGATTITTGVIQLTNGLALQDSPVWIANNDALDINGNDTTVGGLGGAGSLNLGSNTLTIGGSSDNIHLGVISGSGSVTLATTGEQTLSILNTFTGGFNLESGTLKCAGSGSVGSAGSSLTIGDATYQATGTHTQNRPLSFANNSTKTTFNIDSGKTLTWSGLVSDLFVSAVINKSGSGTLAITNDSNVFFGTVNVDDGVLNPSTSGLASARIVLNADNALNIADEAKIIGSLNGSGEIHVANDLTFGNHETTATYSGHISRSGVRTFTKIAGGTQIFTGTSDRIGPTNVDEGTLVLNNATQTPIGVGTVTVGSGATLSGAGVGDCIVTVNSGGALTTLDSASSLSFTSLNLLGEFDCVVDGVNATRIDCEFTATLTGGTLDLSFPNGAPTQAAYVLLSYGTLGGGVSTVNNLPSGYKIDYAYNDGTSTNNVALVADSVAPALDSIVLDSSLSSPTNTDTLLYDVTFSEEVTGVDVSDFTVSHTGATAGSPSISGSGANYTLTIPSVAGDGSISVNLKTSGHGITDGAQNVLSAPSASAVVVIDNTAPLVSITTTESSRTNANSIIYSCAFSEPVSGFNHYNDFYFTGTTNASTDIVATTIVDAGDSQNFTLTVNNLSGDGFLQYRLRRNNITDTAGNKLEISSTKQFDPFSPGLTIDNTAPVIVLNGEGTTVSLVVGDSWSDPVTASDNIDASVTIVTGGDSVDVNNAGQYSVTYDASDLAGNTATQASRTVNVITKLGDWLADAGLTGDDALPSADSDGDGLTNTEEFAFDSDPLSPVSDGKIVGEITAVSGDDYLVLTFPVRSGASFTGSTSKIATIDGVTYTIESSQDLSAWNDEVTEVSSALSSGMPSLTLGWQYRSFRYAEATSATEKIFMRVKIE